MSTTSVVDYPKLEIDGNEFRLKVTLAALRRLAEWNIDLAKTQRTPTEAEPLTLAERSEAFRTLAGQAAAFAHIENHGKLKWAMISIDEMEELLTIPDIERVRLAVTEAMVKAAPTAETSPAATAST
ncbi:MAG TPA: hypothetical protein VFO46_02495 [Candidatus Sulfotelmatobacter sp.]|nr:hypothetical protein [Candidatus Sulfotelmatobacter sp.]